MKINSISIQNDGYVHCKSGFYSAQDILSKCSCYTFLPGINKLIGEIDSGNWAVSYLLSMYGYRPKDFILFEQPIATVNNEPVLLNKLSEYSCYMDNSYPLFSAKSSIKKSIIKGLKQSKSNYSYDDIKNLFGLDGDRIEHSLKGVGNEKFRAMAAIGLAYEKEIFCFPWLSKKQFENYHSNLTELLSILEKLEKIAIVPVGKE